MSKITTRYFNIINLVQYQLCWALAAFYTANSVPFMLIILLIHFALSPSRRRDAQVLVIAIIGIAFDQVFIAFNIIETGTTVIPLWLILLWCSLALCFNHCLHWLTRLRKGYQITLGFICGGLSYMAGAKLTVFSSSYSLLIIFLIYGALWAVLLPCFIKISQGLSRRAQPLPLR